MRFSIQKSISSHSLFHNYLFAFLLGFGALLIVYLPAMCLEHGYFLYYGDYNSQQLPFYSLANDAVRSGSFGWNWYTDLGANFIGSYAFYLLGSPFFWITTILPRSWMLYALPVLLSMKHGIAAMTAYAYIQRFVRSRNAALIGGLLYAFSGFQLFNLFFNHFQDVTAFFPLLLIAMEESINQNRKGVFALAVALMGCINYFFFTGQAVFLVLYFIVRCFSKDFHATPKKFFRLALEAIIGVLLACFLLLPSALAILANNRITSRLYGMDMLAYSDRTRIWRIIESFFLIPDVPARPNLFSSNDAKWASIGGYLPLFSMTGVLSFCKYKEGHWAKRLVLLCTICAFVPILNSCFYALNGSYYARWFYMPICIMALMTAYVLDNTTISAKYGLGISALMMAVFGVISILPTKNSDKVTWGKFAEYPLHFYLVLGICILSLVATAFLFHRRRAGKPILAMALPMTVAACTFCTMTVVYFGAYTPQRAEEYIDKAIDKEGDVKIAVSEDDFFRIDISKDRDNYPMFWGLPCIRAFHSIVPASIMEFYPEIGVTRDVASRPERSCKAIRYLFSVRYYFDEVTPYVILLASIGTVITFTISYLIGKTAKTDVNRMIEKHEMLKKYYVKGEKYSFVFSLALHAVGLSSELLGAFFGSVGMAYVPYLVSSVIGVLPGTAMWLVLGDQKSIFTKEGLVIFLIDCMLVAVSFLYLKHRDKKKAEKAAKSVSDDSEK